ncbi:hypothetical protein M440DRAFT_1390802 [Trichoderma longibrachiatum ATCC 18648]|uniref:Secreted protein n=1 Tax=Trichoderma longibrachiatum ATCC 18648 TaxID=983965 RepID=A0A2T4C7I3_TRILO|nr:hypothetical protein M440DRAFT_1390802 [Trichoderma longibrachiatum ATCC 18648]
MTTCPLHWKLNTWTLLLLLGDGTRSTHTITVLIVADLNHANYLFRELVVRLKHSLCVVVQVRSSSALKSSRPATAGSPVRHSKYRYSRSLDAPEAGVAPPQGQAESLDRLGGLALGA